MKSVNSVVKVVVLVGVRSQLMYLLVYVLLKLETLYGVHMGLSRLYSGFFLNNMQMERRADERTYGYICA